MARGRGLIIATLISGVVITMAPQALADTTLADGTQYCGAAQVPIAYTYGYGHFFVKGPGNPGARYFYISGTTYIRKSDQGPTGGGGYWAAGLSGTGSIDTSRTGSYCSGT